MSQPLKALAPASLKTIEIDYFAPLSNAGSDSSSTDSSLVPTPVVTDSSSDSGP